MHPRHQDAPAQSLEHTHRSTAVVFISILCGRKANAIPAERRDPLPTTTRTLAGVASGLLRLRRSACWSGATRGRSVESGGGDTRTAAIRLIRWRGACYCSEADNALQHFTDDSAGAHLSVGDSALRYVIYACLDRMSIINGIRNNLLTD